MEIPYALFHKLWEKAIGTPNYDENEWRRFESMLHNFGVWEKGQKKDWRIGLSCKPVLRNHEMYYETCHIVDVFPDGTAGKFDPLNQGILMIKAAGGRVFLEESSQWRTA